MAALAIEVEKKKKLALKVDGAKTKRVGDNIESVREFPRISKKFLSLSLLSLLLPIDSLLSTLIAISELGIFRQSESFPSDKEATGCCYCCFFFTFFSIFSVCMTPVLVDERVS